MPFGSEMISSHKAIMIEFIQMYKTMSFLWDKMHPSYQNRPLRIKAYKKLLEKYQEIDDEATVAILKGKLDNMRNSYIRELKKVRSSKKTASNQEEVYSPVLWYYDMFSFLENHVLKHKRADTANSKEFEYFNYDDVEEGSQSNTEYEHLDMLTEYLEDPEDDSDSCPEIPLKRHKIKVESTSAEPADDWRVLGAAIGIQLRDVQPHQAAIAQKLIAEALFYAKIGRLNEDSTICLN